MMAMGIFQASFIVFIVLNVIENLIHYSIGRRDTHGDLKIKLAKPTTYDWIKIIMIMIVFAILQAFFTYILTRRGK